MAVAQLALSLYLPSLPALAKHFQVSPSFIQASLTTFITAFACSQFFYGSLSDRFGRRPILLLGLAITILGTIIIIFSSTVYGFFLGRFIEGLGAGALPLLSRAIIRDKFEGMDLTLGMSYLVMFASLTPAIAPFIGGYINDRFGWRVVFIFLLLYSLVAVVNVLFFLPESKKAGKVNISVRNTIKHFKYLLSNKIFIGNVICIIMAYACQLIYQSISPFIFQNQMHLSSASYGELIMLPAVGFLVGNLIFNRFVKYVKNYYLLLIGDIILILSGAALIIEHLFAIVSITAIIIPITTAILGIGFIYPDVVNGALQPFAAIAGTASSLSGFLQVVGSGVLLSLLNYNHVISSPGLGISLFLCGIVILLTTIFLIIPMSGTFLVPSKKKLKQKPN